MDELRAGLSLATEDELQALTQMLFSRRFNPIDYAVVPTPAEIQTLGREQQIRQVEQRFRFLAADGLTVLRGQTHQLSYRTMLLAVCRNLGVTATEAMATGDIEADALVNRKLHGGWKLG